MRIYLPSTLPAVATVLAEGEVRDVPRTAFAVTPALRAAEGTDDEELEYAALCAAAGASLRLLASDPDAPRRRVVLAAEVPDAAVALGEGTEPAAVTVTRAVPFRRLASVHVDDGDAGTAADIAAAAADPDAGGGGGGDHELLWYATQELAFLVEDALGGRARDGQAG